MTTEWGPLAALIGEWEGDGGLDRSFSHAEGRVIDTPYREKVSMKPFGPVDNGRQRLYGLDYRSSMWRGSEELPFHTEVGYWLWDAAAGEVLRGFVVPRGITVLAGAIGVAADATSYELAAELGDPRYGVSENAYLGEHASTLAFRVTITAHDENSWSYDETTTLRMTVLPDLLPHTDSNRLHRVA